MLDARAGEAPAPDAGLARTLCDRRAGVGADGVLWLLPGPSMVVHNADGSRAETCGNGLRCLVRSLVDAGEWEVGERGTVLTDAGPRECEPLPDGRVRVEMGAARFPEVPGLDAASGVAVDVGNPHLVRFGDADRSLAAAEGPALAVHPAFPEGVNVGFARVVGADALDLSVWERGSGLTAACGSGACAAAAAAVETGLLSPGAVRVLQAGGALTVDVGEPAGEEGRAVRLTGPAERVFSGVLGLRATRCPAGSS